MNVSIIDWYPAFDLNEEMLKDIIERGLEVKLSVIDDHANADIIVVGPYGQTHKINPHYINSRAWKLYVTGENSVPDFRFVHHSLSFIRHGFNHRNFRLPLWWLHLSYSGLRESTSFDLEESTEFLNTNLPLRKYTKNVTTRAPEVIAVFNHPDPMRLWTCQVLNQCIPVVKYGQCFGNGFEWGDFGYKKKINLVSNYRFNYCPENSLHDGYFTEKILHARLAGCIPIVYADKYVSLDFNPKGLINIYDYDSLEQAADFIRELSSDATRMSHIISQPVCTQLPNIDSLVQFVQQSYADYTNRSILSCTDIVEQVSHAAYPTKYQRMRSRLVTTLKRLKL